MYPPGVNPGTLAFTNTNGETKLFKLLQFHFHSPSEHTINGRYYDSELHIVHSCNLKLILIIFLEYETGELAVIGLFFDASKDIDSGLLEELELNNVNIASTVHNPEKLRVPLKEYIERMG
jgi:carbonic anhydrase